MFMTKDEQKEMMLINMLAARNMVLEEQPLIHLITSPIAINDCANAILAVGGRPICAEHPEEVQGITEISRALGVSLANITDARLRSIKISGETARHVGIPSVIDVVGVSCSRLRMDAAASFIKQARPTVIKGNASEITALAEELLGKAMPEREAAETGKDHADARAAGVDVADIDRVRAGDEVTINRMLKISSQLSKLTGSTVLVSGEVDIVSDGKVGALLENGVPELGRVTGTGCLLNALVDTYLSETCDGFTAAMLAAATLGIAGELAYAQCAGRLADEKTAVKYGCDTVGNKQSSRIGLGSFHICLIDALSYMTDDDIKGCIKLQLRTG